MPPEGGVVGGVTDWVRGGGQVTGCPRGWGSRRGD